MTPLDPRALRNAFGTFTTGVTVVTAHDSQKQPIGFTANSFTSVSLDPPLLLVCMANTSSNYEAMTQAAGFAVNILSEAQVEISNTFARPVEDRFAKVDWRPGPFGAPILNDVTAWFDCAMHNTIEAGDHVILMGRVEAFDATPTAGLGYARGAYVTPSVATDALDARTDLIISALIEHDGQVLLVDDGNGGLGLPETAVEGQGVAATLEQLLASTGLQAEPGFVYSVFEDVERKRQHIAFLCQSQDNTPARGGFVPLRSASFDDVTDPALITMLERFAAESKLGNYGIYYGNQRRGNVRPIVRGR